MTIEEHDAMMKGGTRTREEQITDMVTAINEARTTAIREAMEAVLARHYGLRLMPDGTLEPVEGKKP